MPRRKEDPFTCPKCGTRASDPAKTWTLVSPIPDRYGRVTVTIMGSFQCSNCGHTWKSVIKKFKTGGEEGGEGEEPRREPGQVIEIDLSELKDVE